MRPSHWLGGTTWDTWRMFVKNAVPAEMSIRTAAIAPPSPHPSQWVEFKSNHEYDGDEYNDMECAIAPKNTCLQTRNFLAPYNRDVAKVGFSSTKSMAKTDLRNRPNISTSESKNADLIEFGVFILQLQEFCKEKGRLAKPEDISAAATLIYGRAEATVSSVILEPIVTTAAAGVATSTPPLIFGRNHRRKQCQALPRLPSTMEWPIETYSKSQEAKNARSTVRNGITRGIAAYLSRVWEPLVEAGIPITLAVIRQVDPTAGRAIDRYRASVKLCSSRNRTKLPFDALTEREITDRKILSFSGDLSAAVSSDPTLAGTILGRIRRGIKLPIVG